MVHSLGGSSSSLSIQEKVQMAHNLYTTWQGNLHSAPQVRGLLAKLQQSIDTTQRTMRELGIHSICRNCDEEEGGSCCGAGIENKYDAVLLLMNLLLGSPLPERRWETKSCYFAGAKGCMLLARHVLCVNYICAKIARNLAAHDLVSLQHVAGNELDILFALHECIKKLITNNLNGQRVFERDYFPDHQFL